MQSWWQGLLVLHKHLQLLEPISESSSDWDQRGLLVWISCGGGFLSTGDVADILCCGLSDHWPPLRDTELSGTSSPTDQRAEDRDTG